MDMVPDASILVLSVPEAESLVAVHRLRHDTSAVVGLPAHITLAYPFKPPELIGRTDLELMRTVCADIPAFDVRLASVGRFGDDVLFLQPEDPEPLVRLVRGFEAAFPEYPLHGGAFPEPHPHLTVATRHRQPDFEEITRRLSHGLPVVHQATQVQLWNGPAFGSGIPGWRMLRSFPLGG